MLKSLRNLFSASQSAPSSAALPPGERVYAVGDIHGRLDLLRALAAAIEADDAARGDAQTTIILLGDLIDRGPDSAGVIAFVRDWQARCPVRVLAGNHEEMLLASLESDAALRAFLRFGGKETLLSYPIDPAHYSRCDIAETRALMQAAIPAKDIAFIRSFEDQIALGDYLFVHAGIDPAVPLDQQQTQDLRWIREPFLRHEADFGAVVVHGHTIFGAPEVRHNRIGIDTGAYASGRLTALGLEGTARWFIEAHEDEGAVRASQRSI